MPEKYAVLKMLFACNLNSSERDSRIVMVLFSADIKRELRGALKDIAPRISVQSCRPTQSVPGYAERRRVEPFRGRRVCHRQRLAWHHIRAHAIRSRRG